MGKAWHPDFDALSALADGELTQPEASEVRAHVSACPQCAAETARFSRTDALLAAPSSDELAWEALKQTLVSLPAGRPSAETDRAIAAMVRERGPQAPRLPTFWPPAPAGVAVRVAVAVTAAVALVVGVIGSQGAAPQVARPSAGPATAVTAPEQKQAFVAAIQTSVLYGKTNTLYVLNSSQGSVAAYDAKTFALRAQITVGGRPSALALNQADGLVVVLDSSTKTLTEIDPTTNSVVTSTQVDVPGTPTSVQVDNGRYVISSIPDTGGTGPAPLATPGASPTASTGGQVTLIDTATKKTEVTKAVNVAPRLVVPDPFGKFSLLVSPGGTTLVDASYNTISTLPGGIAAAFDSRRGQDTFAILSENAGATDVLFLGKNAPAALHLDAKPYALTAMPRGGFAVLVGEGDGGRIVVIDANGKVDRSVDVAAVGPTLDYDGKTERFTVTSDGAVASAPLREAFAVEETPAPSARPGSTPSASPGASPSGSPAPNGSAAPTASAEPSELPEPAATLEPLPSQPVAEVVTVPPELIEVSDGYYRLPLPHAPVLTAASGNRMWFLDDANGLNSLDTGNARIFRLAQLPLDAQVRVLAAGPLFVYAADVAKGRLFVFDVKAEELAVYALPAVDVSAMTVASSGSLWMSMPGSTRLLQFRPLSHRFSTVDIGTIANALAIDAAGRIWYSSGASLGYYDAEGHRTVGVAWTAGAITSLVVDGGDVVWAGTTDGQVWSVKDGVVSLALTLGTPVTSLVLDPAGQVWYLAPGQGGYRYGPVAAGGRERTIPSPVSGMAPNAEGRVWLADPLGGLYLGLAR